MKFGSLFTGIGGFDLAFERAGMECAWQCEIDKHARNILKQHFTAEVHEDVRTIGKHNLPAVDVICGGFPCQDLSIAGKRQGLAGSRSGLWWEFARIIDEIEPKWVIAENVPGLLSSNGGRDFAAIVQWLAQRGYGVCWRVLDAQYFGVPQRRRRVFIVASLGSGRSAEVLFEREGVCWDTPPSREAGKGIAYAIRKSPSHSGDKGDGGINTTLVSCTAVVSDGSPSLTCNHEQPILFDHSKSAQFKLDVSVGVSPTLTKAHSDHATITRQLVRRLTPVECERLQGFPDGWTAGQADSHRYKQLGNAVAVPVVEWIGRRIVEAE